MEIKVKVTPELIEKCLADYFKHNGLDSLEKLYHQLDQWCCVIEDDLINFGYWSEDDGE